MRLADIVFRLKEFFFNNIQIKHNIPFYIKLETHKNSEHGRSWLQVNGMRCTFDTSKTQMIILPLFTSLENSAHGNL